VACRHTWGLPRPAGRLSSRLVRRSGEPCICNNRPPTSGTAVIVKISITVWMRSSLYGVLSVRGSATGHQSGGLLAFRLDRSPGRDNLVGRLRGYMLFGPHAGQTCVSLLVAGKQARTATESIDTPVPGRVRRLALDKQGVADRAISDRQLLTMAASTGFRYWQTLRRRPDAPRARLPGR
jgi:hypothetical protein